VVSAGIGAPVVPGIAVEVNDPVSVPDVASKICPEGLLFASLT